MKLSAEQSTMILALYEATNEGKSIATTEDVQTSLKNHNYPRTLRDVYKRLDELETLKCVALIGRGECAHWTITPAALRCIVPMVDEEKKKAPGNG